MAERLGGTVRFVSYCFLPRNLFFRGVYGHKYGSNPFADCDYPCLPTMSALVGKTLLPENLRSSLRSRHLGGKEKEVGVMNQLTTNLHFLMVSESS